jgi:tetratricopeptide (TPR) repeat protein
MKRGNIFFAVIAVIILLGLDASFCFAQVGRARQEGVLVDETDKPVANASVIIQYMGTTDRRGQFVPVAAGQEPHTVKSKTNSKGKFVFVNLGSGIWDLSADVPGYPTLTRRISISQVGRNPQLHLQLTKDRDTIIKEKVEEKLSSDANLVQQGNMLYQEGKYDEALEAFNGFLEKTPEFFEIYINIGNCLMKQEKYDEAIAQYNKFLAVAKEKGEKIELQAQATASIGEIYLKREDMKTAQSYFMKSIELNPKDEILAYNVAEIFFGNNNNEEAVKYYEIAAKIKPDWAIPYQKLGYVYLNLGDMKKAIEFFEKFIKMDPENPEVPNIKEVINGLKEM